MRKTRIPALLNQSFSPTYLVLEDQSDRHRGHGGWREGGETHYHLTIAADCFNNLSRVEAHRAINKCLDSEFSSGLHALTITILPAPPAT